MFFQFLKTKKISLIMTSEAKTPFVPKDINKYPSREGIDFGVDPASLDPNRPVPIPAPDVDRMWDKKSAVPPQYLGVAWKNYSARYLDGEKPTLFDLFFGSQEKISHFKNPHPCFATAEKVQACLDRNDDKKEKRGDFCRSIINVFEGCLREHNL